MEAVGLSGYRAAKQFGGGAAVLHRGVTGCTCIYRRVLA